MKRTLVAVMATTMAMTAMAGLPVFNHLGAGVGVGTNGISIEATTTITPFVHMRAGVSIMPGITFNTDADVNYSVAGTNRTSTVDLEGDLARTQVQVIFNVYPVPAVPFYIAAGAYFGGSDLVKISGHCADLAGMGDAASVIIGDYAIPVDENGNVSGGIKVKSFRPYVGIGWGKALPSKLLNFSVDLGVQIHGTPELYTDYGAIDTSSVTDDNTFQKIIDKLKVYPTLTFRLGFRAF